MNIHDTITRVGSDDGSLSYARDCLTAATCAIEQEVWREEAARRTETLSRLDRYYWNADSPVVLVGQSSPELMAEYALAAAIQRLIFQHSASPASSASDAGQPGSGKSSPTS